MSVLLPAPFSPSTAWTSPRSAASSTPSRAGVDAKDFRTLWSSRRAMRGRAVVYLYRGVMTRDELRFRAAFSRFGVGLLALVLLPTFYPLTRPHAWVWASYLAVAAVEQVLIRKRIGGRGREIGR